MKTSRGGFTLVETVMVLALMGVIGAMIVMKIGAFQKLKKLDGEARAIYSIIGHTHAQVLKKDYACLIIFDAPHNQYRIYEDRNANGLGEAGELIETHVLPAGIIFGAASGGPAAGPNATGVPAAKIEGTWSTAMLLDRDRAATIGTGSLYLCSTAVTKKTYCIRMPAGSRKLEFWRWDGSLWTAL